MRAGCPRVPFAGVVFRVLVRMSFVFMSPLFMGTVFVSVVFVGVVFVGVVVPLMVRVVIVPVRSVPGRRDGRDRCREVRRQRQIELLYCAGRVRDRHGSGASQGLDPGCDRRACAGRMRYPLRAGEVRHRHRQDQIETAALGGHRQIADPVLVGTGGRGDARRGAAGGQKQQRDQWRLQQA